MKGGAAAAVDEEDCIVEVIVVVACFVTGLISVGAVKLGAFVRLAWVTIPA